MTKRVILISAFVCEPNFGSERGVGWNWSRSFAKIGYDVIIITQPKFQKIIMENIGCEDSVVVRVVEHPLSKVLPSFSPLVYLHYILWQRELARYLLDSASGLASKKEIKYFVHATFGTIRHFVSSAAFQWPVVFLPLGGGEIVDSRFAKKFSLKNRFFNKFRSFVNHSYLRLFGGRAILEKASLVYSRTRETQAILNKYGINSNILQDVGVSMMSNKLVDGKVEPIGKLRLLYVGRLIYWKGVDLLLDVVKSLEKRGVECELTIVGDGELKSKLSKSFKDSGLDKIVSFVGRLSQTEVFECYRQNDVLLFPTLRDSGGTVVPEAVSIGIPFVSWDMVGPAVTGRGRVGCLVPCNNTKPLEILIEDYSDAVILASKMINTPEYLQARRIYLEDKSWVSLARRVDGDFNELHE